MFTISIDDTALQARLTALPGALQAALLAKSAALAQSLALYVQQDKLSGQVLNVRTGALRDNIAAATDAGATGTGTSASVIVQGDLPYAAIQEYGGTIPAHVIEASSAKALAFQKGGKMIFARYVNWPGAVLPERSYLRSALDDQSDDIIDGLSNSVRKVVEE